MVGTSSGELWWCDTATDQAPLPLPTVQSTACTALAATSRGLVAAFQGGALVVFAPQAEPDPGLAPLTRSMQCRIPDAPASQVWIQ